jgi:dihydrofolate synthase/folylpolyglutamate synthase
MSFDFLQYLNNKTMFYEKINFGVIHKSWNIISNKIKLPYIIHLVGTNGKGSTGRYIASFLDQLNQKVIHYSSPHIIEFNERIWINGKNSSNKQLQFAHNQLQKYLKKDLLDKLTYFEYTTLMVFILSNNIDYLVLEAGLGGEFDATNVLVNDLTVVPSIDIDHTEFLGDTIEEIATTKLKSCDNNYIFGLGINSKVENIRIKVLNFKKQIYIDKDIKLPDEANILPSFLQNNLILAFSVVKYLKFNTNNLRLPKLFARFQKIQPNITIDVGHNVLAANAISKEYINKKINLIYNSYKDKDYEKILFILKPIINKLEIIKCTDKRILEIDTLRKVCIKLNIKYSIFNHNSILYNNNYLVFGSFKVVEEFLLQKK